MEPADEPLPFFSDTNEDPFSSLNPPQFNSVPASTTSNTTSTSATFIENKSQVETFDLQSADSLFAGQQGTGNFDFYSGGQDIHSISNTDQNVIDQLPSSPLRQEDQTAQETSPESLQAITENNSDMIPEYSRHSGSSLPESSVSSTDQQRVQPQGEIYNSTFDPKNKSPSATKSLPDYSQYINAPFQSVSNSQQIPDYNINATAAIQDPYAYQTYSGDYPQDTTGYSVGYKQEQSPRTSLPGHSNHTQDSLNTYHDDTEYAEENPAHNTGHVSGYSDVVKNQSQSVTNYSTEEYNQSYSQNHENTSYSNEEYTPDYSQNYENASDSNNVLQKTAGQMLGYASQYQNGLPNSASYIKNESTASTHAKSPHSIYSPNNDVLSPQMPKTLDTLETVDFDEKSKYSTLPAMKSRAFVSNVSQDSIDDLVLSTKKLTTLDSNNQIHSFPGSGDSMLKYSQGMDNIEPPSSANNTNTWGTTSNRGSFAPQQYQQEDDRSSVMSFRSNYNDMKQCSRCTKFNEVDANFCSKCGNTLISSRESLLVHPEPPPHRHSAPPIHYGDIPHGSTTGVGSSYSRKKTPASKLGLQSGSSSNSSLQISSSERFADPLGRIGCPIISFANNGNVLTMIPQYQQRFVNNNGSVSQHDKVMPGFIKIRRIVDVFPEIPIFKHGKLYDGPLYKLKKKDLLSIVEKIIHKVNDEHAKSLFKYLLIMIQNDGKIPQSATVIKSVFNAENFDLSTLPVSSHVAPLTSDIANSIRLQILEGNTKEAIKLASESGQWSIAIILSLSSGSETITATVSEFTRQNFVLGDPLHALLNVIGGNSNKEDLFGTTAIEQIGIISHWKENLISMASCRTKNDETAFLKLGNVLSQAGLVYPGALCYLLSGAPLIDSPLLKFTMLGANPNVNLHECIFAMQITEVYESILKYTIPDYFIPQFQQFKLSFASYLADIGLLEEASKYCESIISIIKTYGRPNPHFSPNFIKRLEFMQHRLNGIGFIAKSSENSTWISGLFSKIDTTLSGIIGADDPGATKSQPVSFKGPVSKVAKSPGSRMSYPMYPASSLQLQPSQQDQPSGDQGDFSLEQQGKNIYSSLQYPTQNARQSTSMVDYTPNDNSYGNYGASNAYSRYNENYQEYNPTNQADTYSQSWNNGYQDYNYQSATSSNNVNSQQLPPSNDVYDPLGFGNSEIPAPGSALTNQSSHNDIQSTQQPPVTLNSVPSDVKNGQNNQPPQTESTSSLSALLRNIPFFRKSPSTPSVTKATLPEGNSFYYDEKLKKWVNRSGGEDSSRPQTPSAPPPGISSALSRAPSAPPGTPMPYSLSNSRATSPMPSTDVNSGISTGTPMQRSISKRNARSRYVDTLNPGVGSVDSSRRVSASFIPTPSAYADLNKGGAAAPRIMNPATTTEHLPRPQSDYSFDYMKNQQ